MEKGIIVPVALAMVMLVGGLAFAAGRLDVNRASVAELEALPGIGKVRAAAIVAERKTRPFSGIDDLARVDGIGKKLIAELQEQIKASALRLGPGGVWPPPAGVRRAVRPTFPPVGGVGWAWPVPAGQSGRTRGRCRR